MSTRAALLLFLLARAALCNAGLLADIAGHDYLSCEKVILHYVVYPDARLTKQVFVVHNDDCDPIPLDYRPKPGETLERSTHPGIVDRPAFFELPDRATTELSFFTRLPLEEINVSSVDKIQVAELEIIIQLMDTLELVDIKSLHLWGVDTLKRRLLYAETGNFLYGKFTDVSLIGRPAATVRLEGADKTSPESLLTLAFPPAPSIAAVAFKPVSFDASDKPKLSSVSSQLIWRTILLSLGAVLVCIWIGWQLIQRLFGGSGKS